MFRRWYLTWGATPEEVSRTLPGDELLPGPDIVATRAMTISTPPDAIWPWQIRMGSGRGATPAARLFSEGTEAAARASPRSSNGPDPARTPHPRGAHLAVPSAHHVVR